MEKFQNKTLRCIMESGEGVCLVVLKILTQCKSLNSPNISFMKMWGKT